MLSKIFIALIKIYQYLLSPLIGKNCKYYPTCSEYAEEALRAQGILSIPKILYRVLRCNPISKGGYDPFK